MVDQFANRDHNLRTDASMFGSPYICAALANNLEAVQLLFRKCELHNRTLTVNSIRHNLFTQIASTCLTAMMQLFVPSWTPDSLEDTIEDR